MYYYTATVPWSGETIITLHCGGREYTATLSRRSVLNTHIVYAYAYTNTNTYDVKSISYHTSMKTLEVEHASGSWESVPYYDPRIKKKAKRNLPEWF